LIELVRSSTDQETPLAIFKRFSDILATDLIELVTEHEDPEAILRQAVREIEESIEQATRQAGEAIADETMLSIELRRNRDEILQWQQWAEKAVTAGDDHLARTALSRKREHEKLVAALEDEVDVARGASRRLRRQLEGMKAKVAEAKRYLGTLAARNRPAGVRKGIDTLRTGMATELDGQCLCQARTTPQARRTGRSGNARRTARRVTHYRREPSVDDRRRYRE
jgi:phage shock protein A